jgi:hypothetical protein
MAGAAAPDYICDGCSLGRCASARDRHETGRLGWVLLLLRALCLVLLNTAVESGGGGGDDEDDDVRGSLSGGRPWSG